MRNKLICILVICAVLLSVSGCLNQKQDGGTTVAQSAQATTTPTAVVVNYAGKIVFVGTEEKDPTQCAVYVMDAKGVI